MQKLSSLIIGWEAGIKLFWNMVQKADLSKKKQGLFLRFSDRVTYFALNIKAISPEAIAAEAELRPKRSVQALFVSAVTCNEMISLHRVSKSYVL